MFQTLLSTSNSYSFIDYNRLRSIHFKVVLTIIYFYGSFINKKCIDAVNCIRLLGYPLWAAISRWVDQLGNFFLFTQQGYVLISYSIFQAKSLTSAKNVAKRLRISQTCELIYKLILLKNHTSVRNATKRLHSSRTCTNMRNLLVVKLHRWTTITTTIRNPFLLDLKIKNS